MLTVIQVEQALLGGASERRPVPDGGAVQDVPGVQVGIEVEHRQRTVRSRGRPQQRQCDGVIAAERHDPGTPPKQSGRGGMNRLDGTGDVVGADADVTGIDDLEFAERVGVVRRVVRVQLPRVFADVSGTEAGTRTEARPRVERDADHRDVGTADVLDAWQQREGGDPGVARQVGIMPRSQDLVRHRSLSRLRAPSWQRSMVHRRPGRPQINAQKSVGVAPLG